MGKITQQTIDLMKNRYRDKNIYHWRDFKKQGGHVGKNLDLSVWRD